MRPRFRFSSRRSVRSRSGRPSVRGLPGWLARQARAAVPSIGRALLSPYTSGSELASLSGDRAHPLRFGSDELSGYSSELIATLNTFRRRLWLYRSILLLARTGLLMLAVVLVFRLLDLASVLPEPA